MSKDTTQSWVSRGEGRPLKIVKGEGKGKPLSKCFGFSLGYSEPAFSWFSPSLTPSLAADNRPYQLCWLAYSPTQNFFPKLVFQSPVVRSPITANPGHLLSKFYKIKSYFADITVSILKNHNFESKRHKIILIIWKLLNTIGRRRKVGKVVEFGWIFFVFYVLRKFKIHFWS